MINNNLFLKKVVKFFSLFKKFFFLQIFFKYGIAASVEHLRAFNSLNIEVKTYLDIGSNKGQFSILVNGLYPGTTIYAFEPLKKCIKTYANIFSSYDNVSFFQTAIGEEEKEEIIHVSIRDDSSSLLPIGKNQTNIFPGTEEYNTENVQVKRLNHFIKPEDLLSPVFVKIDVQGYELEVLKGCDDLIEYFDHIYVECSFIKLYEGQALADEVIQYLGNHSFKLSGIYNMFYDKMGIAIQADFMFSSK